MKKGMLLTKGFTPCKDLPKIQWRNLGGIMKNVMPSLLLDGKTCFIKLPLDTLQNFREVITRVWNRIVWTCV
jgi:hypothetical protein